MKKSLGHGSIFHDANEPVRRITAERIIIAMEIPSTPTARLMPSWETSSMIRVEHGLGGSGSAEAEIVDQQIYRQAEQREEPVTATARICFMFRQRASPASIRRGSPRSKSIYWRTYYERYGDSGR